MKTLFSLYFLFNAFLVCSAQTDTVDVADLTLKISGTSTSDKYFGFAEGDKVIFSFTEADNKNLKEIDVMDYPDNIKFQDYETSKIGNKVFCVTAKTIYKFSFHNSSLSGRVCKINIRRIPVSPQTKNFNTNVVWKSVCDTSWSVHPEQFLVKSDTSVETVINTVAQVHSTTVLTGTPNRTLVDFILPDNTVSWSYWIGVGNDANNAYQKTEQQYAGKILTTSVKLLGVTDPLILFAVGLIPSLMTTNIGDNVKYWFVSDYASAQNFMAGLEFYQFKKGEVVSDYGKIFDNLSGRKYLALYNDNIKDGINVTVKIVAVVVNRQYETRQVKVPLVKSKQIPLNEG